MNLITVKYNNIANVNLVSESKQLLTDYSDVFNGELGSLTGQVLLQIVEIVTPHAGTAGRMSVSMIHQVKKELTWLEELWDITPVGVNVNAKC